MATLLGALKPFLPIPPTPPGGSNPPGGPPPKPTASPYQWMLAWVILIALMAFANQTAIGHTLIFYALVLVLVLLLVTQYQFIASALAPIGTPAPPD